MRKTTFSSFASALAVTAVVHGLPADSSDNPAAEGFLAAESDAEAIAIADRVMERLGGRQAWDATRVVTWKFFGDRFHVWDRHTGDVRIEGTDRETKQPYLILM
ncbi:MAG: hypothetical protein GY769_12815, partial [bacterium]|nr:hypothetical protein [bacterium]